MIIQQPGTEAEIGIFNDIRNKYFKCEHAVKFNGHRSCNIFFYTFDTSTDMLHHCGSCKFNTKKPTTVAPSRRMS